MPIGLDLDEVLVPSLDAEIKWYNKEYNTNFTREDFTTKRYWEVFDITLEECSKRWGKFREDFPSIPHPELIKGVRQALELLRKYDSLQIVTARPMVLEEPTKELIDLRLPGLIDKIHLVGDTTFPDYRKKSEVCKENDIHTFIDDGVNHMYEFQEDGIRSLLFNHHWNKDSKIPKETIRVYGWMDQDCRGPSVYDLIRLGFFERNI